MQLSQLDTATQAPRPGTSQPPGGHHRVTGCTPRRGSQGTKTPPHPPLPRAVICLWQTSLQGGHWLGFLASPRVPARRPSPPPHTQSHMVRGHPAPPHGKCVCAAAEGKHPGRQSFTKADFTPRSCGALTRARTQSWQLRASQLRICEGYDQPTFTATA